MKNLLILGAVGFGLYGLWLYAKENKKTPACDSGTGPVSTPVATVDQISVIEQVPLPTATDIEFEGMVRHYDASKEGTVAPAMSRVFVPGASMIDHTGDSGWIV